MLDGLTTDVILGMGFLKRYNSIVSWLDCCVGMPCLVRNGCDCKSSANSVGGNMGSLRGNMITCSNGARCCDKVVVSARQVAKSTKINLVSARAFVNIVHGDSDVVTWCTLV